MQCMITCPSVFLLSQACIMRHLHGEARQLRKSSCRCADGSSGAGENRSSVQHRGRLFPTSTFFYVADNLLISTSQDPFICLPVHPLPGFPSSFCFKGIVTRISVIVILVLDSLVLWKEGVKPHPAGFNDLCSLLQRSDLAGQINKDRNLLKGKRYRPWESWPVNEQVTHQWAPMHLRDGYLWLFFPVP